MKTTSGYITRIQSAADLSDVEKRQMWGKKQNEGAGRDTGRGAWGNRGRGGHGGGRSDRGGRVWSIVEQTGL